MMLYLREKGFSMPHRYRTTLRPAGFATLPAGLQWHFVESPQGEHWRTCPGVPVSRHLYGVIETDRELTPEELEHFDIEPAEG